MLTWSLRLANNVQFMEIDCTGRLPPNLPSDFDPHTEQVSTAQGWEESSGVAAAAAKSLQSYPTLCDPTDGSPPGSTVPGILQARTLEWVAISFSNAGKWKVKAKSLRCLTLSNPMDCSLTGSSIHGIFQARVLEWDASAFSNWLAYFPL